MTGARWAKERVVRDEVSKVVGPDHENFVFSLIYEMKSLSEFWREK